MFEQILNMNPTQISFAVLFTALLLYVLKNNEKREERMAKESLEREERITKESAKRESILLKALQELTDCYKNLCVSVEEIKEDVEHLKER